MRSAFDELFAISLTEEAQRARVEELFDYLHIEMPLSAAADGSTQLGELRARKFPVGAGD